MAGGPKALEQLMADYGDRTDFLEGRLNVLHEATEHIFDTYTFESIGHLMTAIHALSITRALNNDDAVVRLEDIDPEKMKSDEYDLGFPTINLTTFDSSKIFKGLETEPTFSEIDNLKGAIGNSTSESPSGKRGFLESQLVDLIGPDIIKPDSVVNIIKSVLIDNKYYQIIIVADPTVVNGDNKLKPYHLLPSNVEVILITQDGEMVEDKTPVLEEDPSQTES